jgi:hypothetical protein
MHYVYKRWCKKKHLKEKTKIVVSKIQKTQLIGLNDPTPMITTNVHLDTKLGVIIEVESHFFFLSL